MDDEQSARDAAGGDAPGEEQAYEPPPPSRVAVGTVIFVGGLLLVLVLLRMAAPAVRPQQKVPSKHVPGPCWLCHAVDEKAKPIDVDKPK